MTFRWLASIVVCCWLVSTLVGCGSDGLVRYEVSGTVTFDGKPVPKGYITITPDIEQGNDGPGGGAAIENGRFVTDSEMGIVGGPHLVRIVGFDGVPFSMEGEVVTDGKSLFPPYETTIDFPKADSQRDFEIPKNP